MREEGRKGGGRRGEGKMEGADGGTGLGENGGGVDVGRGWG